MKIKQIFSVLLALASLGYIGFAAYTLNSPPEQILESKSALEKNKLLQEIRDDYNSSQTAQP